VGRNNRSRCFKAGCLHLCGMYVCPDQASIPLAAVLLCRLSFHSIQRCLQPEALKEGRFDAAELFEKV